MYKELIDHLYKEAALNSDVTLYPHQQRIVDSDDSSKIIAHSVGSGKTLSGIAKIEKMREQGKAGKTIAITPASLRDNFGKDGVGKFTDSKYNIVGNKQEQKSGLYKALDPDADYNIISYEMYRKNPEEILKLTGADTVITDEAHRGKNEGTLTTEQLKKYRNLYKNHISLTGSVVSNSVSDLQPLVDLVSGGQAQVGKNKNEFDKMYIKRSTSPAYKDLHEKRRPMTGFKNEKHLGKELSRYIDFADYDDLKEVADMPEKKIEVKKVPISKEQAKLYKKLLKDDPAMYKLIKNKRLETLKDEEAAQAFSKLIEERKLMNSVGSVVPGVSLSRSAEITPKTKQLIDDLDGYLKSTPDGQAILMSHLINGGTDVLEQALKDKDIPYGTFLGKGNKGVTEETRQQAVKDYNDRKNRVMIVSPAGGEGLSLNDTTWEGVLDPHYNPERMNQMEARGIRSGGLKDREDRTVRVNRYLATMPKTLGIFPSSIKTPDEFIYNIQNNKDKQNAMLRKLLKENRPKEQKQKRATEIIDCLYKEAIEISINDTNIPNMGNVTKYSLNENGKEFGYGIVKRNDEQSKLRLLHVYPKYQGKGYATKVLESVLENERNDVICTPNPVENKALSKDALKNFYINHGFSEQEGSNILKATKK